MWFKNILCNVSNGETTYLIHIYYVHYTMYASLVAQRVKRLPAMPETLVQSLGQEDPLEKELATHSSSLPGESHGWRSLVGYSPWGRKETDTTERLHFTSLILYTGLPLWLSW